MITSWVRHIVTINSSPGVDGTGIQVKMSPWIFFSPSLQVENQIDLTSEGQNNKEISMRISSSISSGENFFTDLNGFQVTAFTVNQNTEEINFFFADDPPEALREAAPSSKLLPTAKFRLCPGCSLQVNFHFSIIITFKPIF